MTMSDFTGREVGARRWPNSHAHPDAWGRPWRGVVLDPTDPEAWADTSRFPGRTPGRGEVIAHLLSVGWVDGVAPVRWEFGRVYWERIESLRPYAEDEAAWAAARAAAHAERGARDAT